jgi:adenylosuccinate lyase
VIDYAASQAHPGFAELWAPITNVILERALWTHVLGLQRRVLPDLISTDDVIAAKSAARTNAPDTWVSAGLDSDDYHQSVLDRIEDRERITRHDLKARLEIFAEDCGHEKLHLGMTSADVVENVMQIRIRDSLLLLQRIHGPNALVQSFCDRYPFRGIKGAMGTQSEQIDLLGSAQDARWLDERLAQVFGFWRVADSIGQVNHRSLDLEWAALLIGWVTEASPTRSPWRSVLAGYVSMLADLTGDTWNEGDVSSSVVRRVAIPGAILAADLALRKGESCP